MRKTFNFPPEDVELVHHIESQPNESAYIRDLVRCDMGKGGKIIDEAYIIDIVKRVLKNESGGHGGDNSTVDPSVARSVKGILSL